MGGRAAYINSGGSGIRIEDREYKTVGILGGKKIIAIPDKTNYAQPTISNTPNTVYFTEKRGQIVQISFYHNHKITRSIDLNDPKGIHGHRWTRDTNGLPKRVSHDPKAEIPYAKLTQRDMHYVKLALQYNQTHGS